LLALLLYSTFSISFVATFVDYSILHYAVYGDAAFTTVLVLLQSWLDSCLLLY
jgi:hypothetical protein